MVRLLQLSTSVESQLARTPVWRKGTLGFPSSPENTICPRRTASLLACVKVVREKIIFVRWRKRELPLRETLECVSCSMLHQQLVGSLQFGVVIVIQCVDHFVTRQADPVVEVATPEYVVVAQQAPTIWKGELLDSLGIVVVSLLDLFLSSSKVGGKKADAGSFVGEGNGNTALVACVPSHPCLYFLHINLFDVSSQLRSNKDV